MLIGQKEIVAQIQLQQLKVVQKFFEKAEFYEKAIEILNKQKHIAENMLFDFELVSQIVKSQYKIYKTLAQDQNRYFAVYFKLGFFGQSFPIMFRNKEFIYRGSRLIRRGDVKDKIQKYFPDAFMLDYTAFPEVAVLESQKKSLQI
jgi:dedicator of cytokinesis protein 3